MNAPIDLLNHTGHYSSLFECKHFIDVRLQITMADEIRELMNRKDEIEKEIQEQLDVLQSVCVMIL